MKYQVEGTIELNISMEVVADNEQAAIELCKNHLKAEYRLDHIGMSHNPDYVGFELDAFEED